MAAKKILEHSGPVMWGGDFNTQSSTKLASLKNLAKDLGLKFVAFNPDLRTKSKMMRTPLDHALVRDLNVVMSECLVGGSDHTALRLELEVA